MAQFYVGDAVKIAVHTDSWMQGFTFGRVVKVTRNWVLVEWILNPRVKRRFARELLEHT